MPRHKKKKRAAASVKKTDWLVGDLVVAKLRGHRPWPAQIQKPEDYGYDPRPHRIFVTFFGTEETCFCSYNKITPFTPAVKKSLAEQLQKINTNPELERAIKEIFAADEELKVSAKTHGSNQKEDEEMVSEKSEDEEPPVEQRSRKRGRVVEETVAPPVPVVDERPAKQEKTVKTMAAEQVQKLPRKVRIKVSTQASDLGTSQQQGDKAGVSSSHTRQIEPVDSVKMPVKNGDRTTGGKVDDSVGDDSSVPLKGGGENVIVEVEETVRHDASENGRDATEKAHEDSSAKGSAAAAKKGSDGVEIMELEDEKSLVSKTTSEPLIGKEDAEKPLVSKTSDPAIDKEDDFSTIKESVTSETPEDGVEKMDVDKLPASKTSEPSIGKQDDSSTAKESVVTSETDAVEKMEVDKESAIEEEKAFVKGPTGKEDSTIVSTNEQQENQSSEAKAQEGPHTVEDMETARAGQKEVVSPVAKEVLLDTSRSERESGVELEREEDSLQNKVSSASTIHEANPKDPVSAVSASTKEEDVKEQKDREQEAQPVSTVSTNDDAVSRAYLIDGADPGKSSSKPTNVGDQVHGSEAVASRLNLQAGAVDQMAVDQVGAVKETEDQNGAVKKVENEDEAVKMAEGEDGALKKVEDEDGGLKKTDGQDAQVKKIEVQGGAEVKSTEDRNEEAKKTEDRDATVKKAEGQDAEMKKREEHASEMKKTEEQDATAELKKIEEHASELKKTEEQDATAELKKIEEHASELKKTEEQDATAELKKIEEQDAAAELKKVEEQHAAAELKKVEKQDAAAELKKVEEQDAATELKKLEEQDIEVKTTEDKDGVVNVTEASTQAAGPTKGDIPNTAGSTEKTLASKTRVAKLKGDSPQIDIGAKAEVATLVAKQEDYTAQIGTIGISEVSSTAKQEGDTPQLGEVEKKVEGSTPAAKQDAGVSKEQPAAAS